MTDFVTVLSWVDSEGVDHSPHSNYMGIKTVYVLLLVHHSRLDVLEIIYFC